MKIRHLVLVVAVCATFAALALANVATYLAVRSTLTDQVDRSLREAPLPLDRSGVGPDDDGSRGPGDGPEDGPAGGRRRAADPVVFAELREPDGRIETVPAELPDGSRASPRLPDPLPATAPTNDPEGDAAFLTVEAQEPGGPAFRVKVSRFADGTALVVAVPFDDTLSTLRRLRLVGVATTLGALGVAALVAAWLIRLGLRPLHAIEAQAERIAAGAHDERLPAPAAGSEIARLATALNTTLDELGAALAASTRSEASLRRFVADASHELRTPVAAVSAYAELFERGAAERPDDLARAMRGIRAETARMTALVEDLLLLAELDELRPAEGDAVELTALAAAAAEASGVIGPEWPVTVEASGPAWVTGDAEQLRRVLDNLLANVRAHTSRGTGARVRVNALDGRVVVEVDDDGPGMGAEQRARAFERFWRADPSRSRRQGGAGLGLAIVAAVVDAHGGTVRADVSPGGGTTIAMELPGRVAPG